MAETIFGALACLSFVLFCWQWLCGVRFPLHRRLPVADRCEPITILKPLKGADDETRECLRSWLRQDYSAPVQILFGVASPDDPACDVVRDLLKEGSDAELIICPKSLGPNAKVSTLVQLEPRIKHEVVLVSDADVWAPGDLLQQISASLRNTGLACCFYRMPPGANLCMRLEAFGTNSDFWTQVLQSATLRPLNFALGAAMAIRRDNLSAIGGFAPLLDYLADDFQLGNRIAATGGKVALCATVVECRSVPMTWREVWQHQLRWARTIRICQPGPFFFSILSNPTLWPLLWLVTSPSIYVTLAVVLMVQLRSLGGFWLNQKLMREFHASSILLAPLSDLLRVLTWALAFVGNRVVWRGRTFRVLRGGKLVEVK